MKLWQQHLEDFYTKYQYNFQVQKFGEYPYEWLKYRTPEYEEFIKKEKFVNHREVFYDEHTIDIDMNKDLHPLTARAEAKKIAKELSQRYQEAGISHKVYTSGGTGCHLTMFFPELNTFNNLDNQIMKRCLTLYFCEGYIRPRDKMGKVQVQKNTLIQLEDAPHRKGGVKKLMEEVSFNHPNDIPIQVFALFHEEKEKNHLMEKYYKTKTLANKPDAITFLENERFMGFKDGRDRALFILIAYYKQFYDAEKVYTMMKEWNNNKLNNYFSDKTIRAKVKSARPGFPVNYATELFIDLGVDNLLFKGRK